MVKIVDSSHLIRCSMPNDVATLLQATSTAPKPLKLPPSVLKANWLAWTRNDTLSIIVYFTMFTANVGGYIGCYIIVRPQNVSFYLIPPDYFKRPPYTVCNSFWAVFGKNQVPSPVASYCLKLRFILYFVQFTLQESIRRTSFTCSAQLLGPGLYLHSLGTSRNRKLRRNR